MKKILILGLSLTLIAGLLAGCGNGNTSSSTPGGNDSSSIAGGNDSSSVTGGDASSSTPGGDSSSSQGSDLAQLYADAITANGGEMAEYNPVITAVSEDDASAMMLASLGLNEDSMDAFAISMSLMNTQAYTIAAIMPAASQESSIMDALQAYIENMQRSFENYLPGPYEVACNAQLAQLSDGTILLVMCENQDEVFQAIEAAIAG